MAPFGIGESITETGVLRWTRPATSIASAAYGDRDARTLARDLLGMTQADLSAAFKGSPMKRAKLRGPQHNAAVVLGNSSPDPGQAARAEDVDVLTRTLDDPEPLVREHAAWALARIPSHADGNTSAPATEPG